MIHSLSKSGGIKTKSKLNKMTKQQSSIQSKIELQQNLIDENLKKSKEALDKFDVISSQILDKMKALSQIRQDIDDLIVKGLG